MRPSVPLMLAGLAALLMGGVRAPGQDKTKPDVFEKMAVDWYGDPLPANAMARLGTRRWRHVGKGPYRTEVAALAFAPDGKTVASVGHNSVCLWERGSGRLLGEFEIVPCREAPTLTFSANGNRLSVSTASGPEAYFLRSEGPLAVESLRWRPHPHGAWAGKWDRAVPGAAQMALAPDGRSYVAVEGRSLVQRHGETDREPRRFGPFRETIRSLAISPKGKLACLLRSEVVLFDLVSGKDAGRIDVPMHYPLALAFAPDGQTLAVGHTNGFIRMVDLRHLETPTRITGHQAPVLALAFAPSGKWLASLSSDSLRLWDMTTGEEKRVLPGSVFGFTAMALAPDGKIMATGHERVIVLWDTDTWKKLEEFPVAVSVDALAFAPDGKTLLSNIGRIDMEQPRKYRFTEGVWSNIAFSADGGTVVKTSRKGHGPFLFRADGTSVHSFYVDLLGGPFAVAPLGTTIAGAMRESGQVSLYEPVTGRTRRNFDTGAPVEAIAFAPDARTLAATAAKAVCVWNVADAQLHTFTGHDAAVTSLAFSPDGKILASGSVDATVLLWDLKKTVPARAPQPGKLEIKTLEELWGRLADDWDMPAAYGAMEKLSAAKEQAVTLFRVQLPALAARLKPRVETQQRSDAAPIIGVRREGNTYVPFVKNRIAVPSEYLQVVRALEVLEFIGTTEAYRLVGELANDPATAAVAREARAALGRMAKQRGQVR
jgi:WD40 repeat protein